MSRRIAILLGVCGVLGCTFIGPTAFDCVDDSSCPSGFICGGSGTCVAGTASVTDAGLEMGSDAGPGIDGGVDAGPAPLPPSDLSYSFNPVDYFVGQPIIDDPPMSSGGAVVSYSVAPTLPAGLTLSATTGVLSGTPTAVSPMTNYTVTARNAVGSTTATLTITVSIGTCMPQTNMACPNGQICNLSGTCATPKYSVSNQTVTDDVTQLVWQQTVPANPCAADGTGVCTWSDAMAYCQGLTLNGATWTLPSLTQLYSLVLMGMSPTIMKSDFPSVTGVPFWTSTTDGSGRAWTVDFGDGFSVGSVSVTLTASVLCVH
jgi:hypothetical protein